MRLAEVATEMMNRREFTKVTGLAATSSWLMRGRLTGAVGTDTSPVCQVIHRLPKCGQDILLASPQETARILVDPRDHPVVYIAAGMLAEDLERVTGGKPEVTASADEARTVVIIGTLAQSRWVDRLVAEGKLDVAAIRGRWEASLWQAVAQPFPGIDRALVIVGSDRRGTAYGVMDLCEAAGVSPWFWWADVPVRQAPAVTVTPGKRLGGEPGVKYRGIFINDEDWGFEPWAAKTFDPALGNVGPKTYQKVFDLMLRLKLNYLWPAMHGCSTAFGMIPENSVRADQYAIVMGSSHVEPLLANPAVFLKDKANGPWNFITNRKKVLSFWRGSVERRKNYEAIWTVGMRGPYDSPLLGVQDLAQERSVVRKIIALQRNMLDRYVPKRWGPVAECYVPYKEALLVFNSGLEVPRDVTLVWPENNFGYIRQLSTPQQRERPGGAGVYYHIEYFGGPHSYCWLDTTPPALIWEELKKAWDNDTRAVWVINVGGIKPREVGVDFAARLAWNPEGFGPDAQQRFLRDFAAGVCGAECSDGIAGFMAEYYRLGQIRKPEFMSRQWAASLPGAEAQTLMSCYHGLLKAQEALAQQVPEDSRDAFFELFGYPARMLAATGLVFLYDRLIHAEPAHASEHRQLVARWRAFIEQQVAWYNNKLAGGKWRYYATMGGTTNDRVWAAVQWPWLQEPMELAPAIPKPEPLLKLDANGFTRNHGTGSAGWREVQGLGWSGGAMALWPAVPANQWNPETELISAPRMEYSLDIPEECSDAELVLHVLPTYELHPGMQLRVAVRWDDLPLQVMEVPCASSETRVAGNPIRSAGVLDNHISLRLRLRHILSGKHLLTVFAVDPGIVIDQISLVRGAPAAFSPGD